MSEERKIRADQFERYTSVTYDVLMRALTQAELSAGKKVKRELNGVRGSLVHLSYNESNTVNVLTAQAAAQRLRELGALRL